MTYTIFFFSFNTWTKSCIRHPVHYGAWVVSDSYRLKPSRWPAFCADSRPRDRNIFRCLFPFALRLLSWCFVLSFCPFILSFSGVYVHGIGCYCRTVSSSFLRVEIAFSIFRIFSFVAWSFVGIPVTLREKKKKNVLWGFEGVHFPVA